ncbi:3-deoxy-D-manno-octulosonic acid transferase [Mariprofundus sp. NF]|uniref:3-deoxy-D-manno-octulosonic acid transferase n=1 Tax=Mariprofundus sp. NF TaxID=2608716 RepID=UPI0021063D39|nr:3-deoxy-D-manno-octulosonic acid transferase [Mariprofundus sp. NF]
MRVSSEPSSSELAAIKWKQHLMLQPPATASGCIWVHACSVGEVGSVMPLIRVLLDRGHDIHLTVVTATGFAHAHRLLGNHISISYLPWDLPTLFSRFLRTLKPALLLLAETEFWPGMLRACHRQKVPVIGINTRISDRSFPRYRASRFFWRPVLKPVSLFLAQSEIDAERLIAMGVNREKVRVAGNLKYAITAPEVDAVQLRQQLDAGGNRPILLVASTHEKEDEKILDMWPAWHACCPELLTVIVPRHPQRFDQVAEKIRERGLKLNRWSALENENSDASRPDVILIDAMGLLGKLYTVADAVIIAGSLTNIGGHNPLEAAICGRGVVTGPYIQNFRDIMDVMKAEHAAIVAADDNELEKIVSRLLSRPNELQQLNGSAALFIRDKSEVLARIMAEIEPSLAGLEKSS